MWRTNDTEAGTYMVKDINPGIGNVDILYNIVSGVDIYFQANNEIKGFELWRTNGTEKSTFLLVNTHHGPYPSILYISPNILFFSAIDVINGKEL